jgi:two-component system response regulator AtoC
LRALQEQLIRRVGDEVDISIDVRIISATLRNLGEEVRLGRFREDLLYRLNVISIHLQPLRERTEDIPLLVDHFMQKHIKRLGIAEKRVPLDVLKALLNYSWPGNARELENALERALVLSSGDALELSTLPESIIRGGMSMTATDGAGEGLSIKVRTEELERRLIKIALEQTSGNRTKAAKILDIGHRTLLYKLKGYGLG